jgi:hypothetical protein
VQKTKGISPLPRKKRKFSYTPFPSIYNKTHRGFGEEIVCPDERNIKGIVEILLNCLPGKMGKCGNNFHSVVLEANFDLFHPFRLSLFGPKSKGGVIGSTKKGERGGEEEQNSSHFKDRPP